LVYCLKKNLAAQQPSQAFFSLQFYKSTNIFACHHTKVLIT
jgi:hypothetical protein